MISQISIRTEIRHETGDTYDVARLWIAGIPFQAVVMGEIMERQIRRIAEAEGADFLDRRTGRTLESEADIKVPS